MSSEVQGQGFGRPGGGGGGGGAGEGRGRWHEAFSDVQSLRALTCPKP